jgi:hypothetical protein
MMEANELRIGNYVSDIHSDDGAWKVVSLGERICHYGNYPSNIYKSKYENLRPIELTEQWLLDFGFEKGKNNWFHLRYSSETEVCEIGFNLNSGRFIIINLDEDDHVPVCAGYTVEYVHQLMNIYFSLTQTELQLTAKKA